MSRHRHWLLTILSVLPWLFVTAGYYSCASVDTIAGGGSSGTPNGTIVASVRYPDGTAASGIFVKIRPASFVADTNLQAPVPALSSDLVTDEDGQFKAEKLDTGSYIIECTDNASLSTAFPAKIAFPGASVTLESISIDSAADVRGVLRGPGGEPVEGNVAVLGLEKLAKAGGDGAFALPVMPKGCFVIVVGPVLDRYSVSTHDSVAVDRSGIVDIGALRVNASGGSRSFTVATTSRGVPLSENITNFPLLVRLDTTRLDFSSAQGDRSDLHFTSDGREFPFEIDTWDSARGNAAVWVLLDTLAANSEKIVVVSWGGSEKSANLSPAQVFDTSNSFAGVWHLSESSPSTGSLATYRDATNFGRHGDDFAANEGKDGIIGKGQQFSGYDYIEVRPPFTPAGQFTIEAWFRLDTIETFVNKITGTFADSTGISYGWQLKTHKSDVNFDAGDGTPRKTASAWQVTQAHTWYHYAVVYTPGQSAPAIYLNGQIATLNDPVTASGIVYPSTPHTYVSDPELPFGGAIDEVRYSNAARSAAWIRMCYENQRSDQKLVLFE